MKYTRKTIASKTSYELIIIQFTRDEYYTFLEGGLEHIESALYDDETHSIIIHSRYLEDVIDYMQSVESEQSEHKAIDLDVVRRMEMEITKINEKYYNTYGMKVLGAFKGMSMGIDYDNNTVVLDDFNETIKPKDQVAILKALQRANITIM